MAPRRRSSMTGFIAATMAVAATQSLSTTEAFAFQAQAPAHGSMHNSFVAKQNSGSRKRVSRRRSVEGGISMYIPPHARTSQTSVMAASNMFPSGVESSLANPTDTFPQANSAHGLLSPQTVKRLDERNTKACGNPRNEAVGYFLDTYKDFGPMACLSMLSDPEVLPELTKAMRESSY